MSQNRDDEYGNTVEPFGGSGEDVVGRAMERAKARGGQAYGTPEDQDQMAESIYGHRPEFAEKLAERRKRAAARAAAGVRRVSGNMGSGY